MATTVARLQAVLSADTRDFDRGMEKSHSTMRKVGKVAAVGLGAGVAIAAIALKKSVGAAMDAEKAQTRLNQAFSASKVPMNARKKAQEEINRVSRKAALDDEDLSDVLARLTRSTGSVGKATKGMALSAEIARGRNVSLEVASKAVEKAYLGQEMGLKKLGVVVPKVTKAYDDAKTGVANLQQAYKEAHGADKLVIKGQLEAMKTTLDIAKAKDKEKTATNALALAQKQFAGSSEAYGKTAAGAQERFQVAVENLQESIGKKLLPLLTILALKAAKVIEWLEANWPRISEVFNEAWLRIKPSLDSLMATVVDVVALIRKHWGTIGPIVENVAKYVQNAAEIIIGALKLVAALLRGDWSEAWKQLKGIVGNALDQVRLIVETAGRILITALRKLGESLKNAVIAGLSGLAGLAWDVIAGIGRRYLESIQTIIGWGQGIGNAIKNAVVNALQGIGGAAWGVINNIGERILAGLETELGWGRSIATAIRNGVVNTLTGIGQAAWEVINNIGSKLQSVKEAIMDWGKAIGRWIVHGIISVIRDAPGAVWDAVKDLVGGVVNRIPHSALLPTPSGPGQGGQGGESSFSGNVSTGRKMAAVYGWTGAQFDALYKLWQGESGWNERARNKTSGAYGIPQSLPASKMASAGSDYLTNAATQIKWGLGYISGRYGNPVNAYNTWLARNPHWYDKGGWLPPGLSLAMNNTGRSERVLGPNEGGTIVMNFPNYVGSKSELMSWLQNAAAEFKRRNGRSAF